MYALEEYKSRISKLGNIDAEEDVRYFGVNNERELVKNVIISESEIIDMQQTLQIKCNQLQDKLDVYNATHNIEFDTPLC